MGWRGRGSSGSWTGPWPGRGQFSYLPPWQRPGWLYGRGACWWLYGLPKVYLPPSTTLPVGMLPALKPEDEAALLAEQKTMIEEQLKAMQEVLKKIQDRLEELKK